MKRADLGQKKVAPKKTEKVKEVLDDEDSGSSVNEVSSLLSTQKIEHAIIRRALEEQPSFEGLLRNKIRIPRLKMKTEAAEQLLCEKSRLERK